MTTQGLPSRPEKFSAGADLAVGTYHVVRAEDAFSIGLAPLANTFTICRTVGLHRWYPLTRKDNPAWRTWATRDEAQSVVDNYAELSDYPFWGR